MRSAVFCKLNASLSASHDNRTLLHNKLKNKYSKNRNLLPPFICIASLNTPTQIAPFFFSSFLFFCPICFCWVSENENGIFVGFKFKNFRKYEKSSRFYFFVGVKKKKSYRNFTGIKRELRLKSSFKTTIKI